MNIEKLKINYDDLVNKSVESVLKKIEEKINEIIDNLSIK